MMGYRSRRKRERNIKLSIWVVQSLLAGIFMMAGFMKTTLPIDSLGQSHPWANQVPDLLVRFIGVVELLGGIGLLLPAMLRYRPEWSNYSAMGLVLLMVVAMVYHLVKAEYGAVPTNIILASFGIYVLWGRYKKDPITPAS